MGSGWGYHGLRMGLPCDKDKDTRDQDGDTMGSGWGYHGIRMELICDQDVVTMGSGWG